MNQNGIPASSSNFCLVFVFFPTILVFCFCFVPHYSLHKLQVLVYDILPSTTAVFSYAVGSRKLSANEQFFVGAQTVVRLLQTTQIKQGVSFIAANKVYTSTNKNHNRLNRDGTLSSSFVLLFYPGWMRLVWMRACFGARFLLQSY